MNKLITINKYIWQITKILFGILLILIGLFITQQITRINYINLFTLITNAFIATFAGLALFSWKIELKQKRKYEHIDELLKNIIRAQNMLKYDFPRAGLNLVNVHGKKVTEEYIHKEVVEIGDTFDLLSSKVKTISTNKEFIRSIKHLSKRFKQYVLVDDNEQKSFYYAYLNDYKKFKVYLDNELTELRINCENL